MVGLGHRLIVRFTVFQAVLGVGSLTIVGAPEKEISKIAYVVQECVQACYDEAAAGATDLSDLSDALVYVTASGELDLTFHSASTTGPDEEADLQSLGATVVNRLELPAELGLPSVGMIQAKVPYDMVEAAAGLPWVVAVTPPGYGDVDPHPTNPINSEGVPLHNADLAQNLGITGAGVSIGAISDGVSNLAVSQAANELPAVNVLAAGSGDEGTAMLEIIHDMAPGAALLFDATGGGVLNHTAALINLVANGANVIAEDIAFDAEPAFQQGLAAATAEAIAALGVSVHSSAGNRGQNHAARVQAVGTGGGPDGFGGPFVGCGIGPTNTVAIAPGADTTFDLVLGCNGPCTTGSTFTLQWSEPRAISPTPGAGGFTDLDLYIMDATGTICLGQSLLAQFFGAGDTIEQITMPAAMAGTPVKVVVNVFGSFGAAGAPTLDLRWRRTNSETDAPTRAGSLNPDSNYTGLATSAAAINATNSSIEAFSSGGPVQLGSTTVCPGGIYPCAGGVPGPGLASSAGPTWAAADGVAVSGVGGFGNGTCPAVNPGDCRFFGTSASAPHAGACDALVRELIGPASPVGPVNTRLTSTATDFAPPGPDNTTGAGLLDCLDAVGPPDADAGPNQSVEWVDPGVLVSLDGSGSTDPNNDPLTYTWAGGFSEGGGVVMGVNPMVTFTSLGIFGVQLTVEDPFGLTDTDAVMITVEDTTDPVITCASDIEVECSELGGTPATDAAIVAFLAGASASDACDPDPSLSDNAPGFFSKGDTDVEFTATDDSNNSDSCVGTVTVIDTTAPTIECNAPATIVPPDAPISFTATATDICDGDVEAVITAFDCFAFTKKGKRIDKTESCVVGFDEDSVTILDSGGVIHSA